MRLNNEQNTGEHRMTWTCEATCYGAAHINSLHPVRALVSDKREEVPNRRGSGQSSTLCLVGSRPH